MSFYGSVYYQLINSFYKTITSNSGKEQTNFPEDNSLENRLEIEAIGRKGVLNLDSGNRWIGITQEGEGEDKVVKFWHQNANKNNSNETINGEAPQENVPLGSIQNIPQGGYFKSDVIAYDSAGHIADVTSKWYKLPISDIDRNIEDLTTRVETAENDIQDLDGATQDNKNNIEMLQDLIGEWNPNSPNGAEPAEGTVSYVIEDMKEQIQQLKDTVNTQQLSILYLAGLHNIELPG